MKTNFIIIIVISFLSIVRVDAETVSELIFQKSIEKKVIGIGETHYLYNNFDILINILKKYQKNYSRTYLFLEEFKKNQKYIDEYMSTGNFEELNRNINYFYYNDFFKIIYSLNMDNDNKIIIVFPEDGIDFTNDDNFDQSIANRDKSAYKMIKKRYNNLQDNERIIIYYGGLHIHNKTPIIAKKHHLGTNNFKVIFDFKTISERILSNKDMRDDYYTYDLVDLLSAIKSNSLWIKRNYEHIKDEIKKELKDLILNDDNISKPYKNISLKISGKKYLFVTNDTIIYNEFLLLIRMFNSNCDDSFYKNEIINLENLIKETKGDNVKKYLQEKLESKISDLKYLEYKNENRIIINNDEILQKINIIKHKIFYINYLYDLFESEEVAQYNSDLYEKIVYLYSENYHDYQSIIYEKIKKFKQFKSDNPGYFNLIEENYYQGLENYIKKPGVKR